MAHAQGDAPVVRPTILCALIDVRTMAHLLVRAEREHHLDLS